MISERFDLDEFVEAIKNAPLHEVLTLTLREHYDSQNLIAKAANPDLVLSEYSRALDDFLFVIQVGGTPAPLSERERVCFLKFRPVVEGLVESGEFVPLILKCFE